MENISKFINDQLSVWPMAASNFRALKTVRTKKVTVNGMECTVQFNPHRVSSSTAKTDAASIAARPCFLCPENRPKEQFHIKFNGRKSRRYNIQVNPFPIFQNHLVIARDEHIPQRIWHHFPDMLDFCCTYRSYTVFYNGPMSGASAPDHLHFQACPRHMMPLENAVDAFLDNPPEAVASVKDARLYHYDKYARGIFALKAGTSKSMAKLFYRLLDCTDRNPGEDEPRFNLYCFYSGNEYRAIVVMRSHVRSHHYSSTGADHVSISPGAADMLGVFVAPFKEDFSRADSSLLEEMLSEVTISGEEQSRILGRLTRTQPILDVGIMRSKEIVFEIISDGAGPQKVSWCDGRIAYNGMLYDELYFDSMTLSTLFAEASFILHGVTIGINFHWEQKRDFRYAGGLRFVVDGDELVAINRIGLEDYLLSVISSEMASTSSPELLKAHAVISRSWVMSRMRDRREGAPGLPHNLFDVCADDHCQRYQGLTMALGENVRNVIDSTWGQVLRYNGELCDARYSKCCGGRTELFSTCWEDVDPEYLQSFEDSDGGKCFCDCQDNEILSEVLNDYDLKTRDFFRWEVRYSRKELSQLVESRSKGEDFGEIQSLEPVQRGPSGRIKYLRIVGSRNTAVIGKELEIRRYLSPSHLKSSAFEIKMDGDVFILEGKGWGHGVGLCQIGAAVMAHNGYGYKEILKHYYRGTQIG